MKNTNIFKRLLDAIKADPIYASVFLFPLLFSFIIPGIVSLPVVVSYVILVLYLGVAGYASFVNKDNLNRVSLIAMMFIVFGIGHTMLRVSEEADSALINVLFWVNLVGVIGLNIFTAVKMYLNVSNPEQENKEFKLNILLGLAILNLFFFIAKPISLANQDNILMYIDFILYGIIILTVNYVAISIYKLIKSGTFIPSESKTFVDTSSSVLAIIIGLLFGLVFMFIFDADQATTGFWTILQGAFYENPTNGVYRVVSMGNTIYFAVPIILTGLSIAFAFRTGLFNIGSTGQMTMGAYWAVYVGIEWGFLANIHPLLHWLVAVLVGALAGAVWGLIPGLLKAYRNVNEVVAGIMLNYIAMFSVINLIKGNIYNVTKNSTYDIMTSAETPNWNLDWLFPDSSISGSIIVAIVVVVILHIVLNKTTFGFELKAVGFNRDASKYAGMNEKRNIALSMAISGAVAGIAGAMLFLVGGKNMEPTATLLAEGFTGIAIALLGLNAPLGVLISGLFFASLQRGGYYMQLTTDFKPELIDIILSVIIYASALSLVLQKFVKYIFRQRKKQDELNEGSDQ